MARVVLAMSGGVDSSVAAHLLLRAGHEVIGLFMRHGEVLETACAVEPAAPNPLAIVTPGNSHKQGCCSASDAADARRIADRLDIPFYALDFSESFGRIMDYFADEYVAGRTPNPCVMCNNWLKFGKLVDYADSVGAEFVATGHYARLLPTSGGNSTPGLYRGLDRGKDQSYVLFGVERHVLSRMMLPVGEFQKEQIRDLAREMNLRVAEKRDSQEICFVRPGEHPEFVRRRRGVDLGGDVVTVEGEVVGQHTGIENYTIGQRKGLKLAFGDPRYVVRIEAESRRVVIGTREQLARETFTFRDANWLASNDSGDEPTAAFDALVQIRYSSRATPATVTPLGEGRWHCTLHESHGAVAPGQAAVCYVDDRVLGGGWIE